MSYSGEAIPGSPRVTDFPCLITRIVGYALIRTQKELQPVKMLRINGVFAPSPALSPRNSQGRQFRGKSGESPLLIPLLPLMNLKAEYHHSDDVLHADTAVIDSSCRSLGASITVQFFLGPLCRGPRP
jgi:hypothetical protein